MATIKQVAQEAGVSTSTVSRVLNGRTLEQWPTIAKRAEHIRRVARKLNYQPCQLGRALRSRKTMAIGLICKGLGSPVAMEQSRRLMQHARDEGYLTYLVDLQKPGDDSEIFNRTVQDMLSRRVDGLVISRTKPLMPSSMQLLKQIDVPIVYLGWGPSDAANKLEFVYEKAMRQVAAHLKQLGHEHAGYLPTLHSFDYPQHNIEPYKRAFAETGIHLTMHQRWAWDPYLGTEDQAYEMVRGFIRHAPSVTALVMQSDRAAVAAIAALDSHGLKVPQDISLVGLDDDPAAKYISPPLTTLRWPPPQEIASSAFNMLNTLIEHPDEKIHPATAELELVIRNSTSNARTNGPAMDVVLQCSCATRSGWQGMAP